MSKNRIIAVIGILAIIAIVFAIANVQNRQKPSRSTVQIQQELGVPVQTAVVEMGSIEDTVTVTGDVKTLNSVTLSPKVQGRVSFVAVREGDVVKRGQVLVQLDRSDAEANMRQARAALEAAEARLSQARTSVSVTEVQSSAAVRQARAGLAAAQANYEKVRSGARSQERMIAEQAVAQAKANLDNAQANLRRYKQLYAEGAVAQAQLDVAQTQYDVALAGYNSARQNLSLVEEGARSEDVRAAQTQVTQAREALRAAQANAAQVALRREDVKSAQAGVSQAKAQVALAQEQINNTYIRSSIDGVVSERMVDPGQTVSPGQAVLQVVDVQSLYMEADVSETVLPKIRPGQTVSVKVDAYRDLTFQGSVQKINPAGSTATRNFRVRISIPNTDAKLRPGMFARGSIITDTQANTILVTQDAVEERDGQYIVFTVEKVKGEYRARKHSINRGLSNPQLVEVVPPTTLKVGDTVITAGHESLEDNSKINIGRQAAAR